MKYVICCIKYLHKLYNTRNFGLFPTVRGINRKKTELNTYEIFIITAIDLSSFYLRCCLFVITFALISYILTLCFVPEPKSQTQRIEEVHLFSAINQKR